MTHHYHPLPTYPLPKNLSILPPDMLQMKKVSMESPALDVMTDFKKEHAITISSHESIEAAKRKMEEKGIRLLIAVDLHNYVHGIIRTSDISGDKPIRYIQEFGGTRKDITVEDIMIPERDIEVLAFQDVMHMKVGDIVETLKKLENYHALVAEIKGPEEDRKVRGLFSLNRIARQLGVEIQIFKIGHTFAQIAQSTSHIKNPTRAPFTF